MLFKPFARRSILFIILGFCSPLFLYSQSFAPPVENPFGLDEGKTIVGPDRNYFADIDGDGDLDNFSPTLVATTKAIQISNSVD